MRIKILDDLLKEIHVTKKSRDFFQILKSNCMQSFVGCLIERLVDLHSQFSSVTQMVLLTDSIHPLVNNTSRTVWHVWLGKSFLALCWLRNIGYRRLSEIDEKIISFWNFFCWFYIIPVCLAQRRSTTQKEKCNYYYHLFVMLPWPSYPLLTSA